MTLQEIYDKVKAHLLSQNRKSLVGHSAGSSLYQSGDTSCAYRGYAGTKCAIGVLIPDVKYSHAMEELGSLRQNDLVCASLNAVGIDTGDPITMGFLCALQRVHDSEIPSNWPTGLTNLARNYKLQP